MLAGLVSNYPTTSLLMYILTFRKVVELSGARPGQASLLIVPRVRGSCLHINTIYTAQSLACNQSGAFMAEQGDRT